MGVLQIISKGELSFVEEEVRFLVRVELVKISLRFILPWCVTGCLWYDTYILMGLQ